MLNISHKCLKIIIILFSYCMTQKFSELLKKFWIAMLPCYGGFSLSAGQADACHVMKPGCQPVTVASSVKIWC